MSALYSPVPKVGMTLPGFIAGEFLIHNASALGWVRNSPAAKVWRVPKCVRFGPLAWSSVMYRVSPLMLWQVRHGALARLVTSSRPALASPSASSASSNFVAGSGVDGSVNAGSFSSGKTHASGAGAGFGVAGVVIPGTPGMPASFTGVLAAPFAVVSGASIAAGEPAASVFWCATHLSNSAGVTVNARKRMLAWLKPQYSTQAPFQALDVMSSFGVNQR